MLNRKAMGDMLSWKQSSSKSALLVTGARQVGKTYLIRKFAQTEYDQFSEINFIENPLAAELFSKPVQTKDLLDQLSLIVPNSNLAKRTLVFFDEIQVCPDIMTSIKFLVDDGTYDYVLSGSLLGTELRDIRSVPVGYVRELKMYPLDFEEFCWSQDVRPNIFQNLISQFRTLEPINAFTHNHFLNLFNKYLVIGGMPDAVKEYVKTSQLSNVRDIQEAIKNFYKRDISQYCKDAEKLHIKETYDLIPSELNNPNKRFILKQLNENARFRKFEDAFIWLTNAGVALASYNVTEPVSPLLASRQRNLFKLFCSDVGILMSSYSNAVALKILSGDSTVNCGAMYENVVAQELYAHGYKLYYYNSKKHGELDFIIETQDGDIIPIEVKSGKSYKRHRALSNILKIDNYNFRQAIVFGSENIYVQDDITYAPIYLISALLNN